MNTETPNSVDGTTYGVYVSKCWQMCIILPSPAVNICRENKFNSKEKYLKNKLQNWATLTGKRISCMH